MATRFFLVALAALAAVAGSVTPAHALWIPNGVPVCTAAGDQSNSRAASDNAGGAIIVWADSRSGNQDIYAQRLNASGVRQWAANGVPVCTAANGQTSPDVVADGAGGAYVVWMDSRSPSQPNIYLQRITSTGAVATGWRLNGICVCTSAVYPYKAVIVADGSGGAVVAWEDYRSGYADIYAQRIILADTTRRWPVAGLAVCSATGDQTSPVCVGDGSGGMLFAWQDARASAMVSDVYVQHLTAEGVIVPGWPLDGTVASPTSGLRTAINPTLVADGASGLIVAWEDYRNVNAGIYALRLTAGNTIPAGWVAGGIAVCDTVNDQKEPLAVPDGSGGTVVVWKDDRINPGVSDLYAKRMTGAGAAAPGWPPSGAAVCTAAGEQAAPRIVPDGAGGAVVTWYDYRAGTNTDIYAQRLTWTGDVAPGWATNGLALCSATRDQQGPTAVPDGSGGAIVAWQDYRSGTNYDIYATRVTGAGGGMLDVSGPPLAAFRIHEPRPNPSSRMATFAFELPAERAVEASVFDLAGRLMRTLEPGRSFPAGTHQLAWDGRDDGGSPVAAGVYLVRMKAGSEVQVRRMVRLR
jgi:hypothetical protein